ncbi:global transcription activator, SNF2 family member, putative [Theileria annulata]|uniref:Global transcription activator, SNF2 family member, putative n=1 Tax=Theileria annulata TaxID=5874 RepID=Q4UCU5_THEAN|nr:global transcription activator, SNF2 family member, putative [Theileria annulata]CAI75356.1 global transcription activator, SNF2 family member, putative [Theileria annulata]|eukprot:XP_954832.1 global transcription activator, SNF2 family member, putative [Theileria annulata]
MDFNNYNDVVYSLYKLSNSGVDQQDVRYHRLLCSLNRLRAIRGDNQGEWNNLSGKGQNPFTPSQYKTLLSQIEAYTKYITKCKKIPKALLSRCNPKCTSDYKYPSNDRSADKVAVDDNENLTKNNESARIADVGNVFHRKNQFWGPGHFWIDYKDNLEQNKLSFFLGAITNVKTMTQHIIQYSNSNNKQIIHKFEQLFKDIGLKNLLTTFKVSAHNNSDNASETNKNNSTDLTNNHTRNVKNDIQTSNETTCSESGTNNTENEEYTYDFNKLLIEILKLEKKINLLLLQKNVRSILSLTKLINPLYKRQNAQIRGSFSEGNSGSSTHITKTESLTSTGNTVNRKYFLDHVKTSNQFYKDNFKMKRKLIILSNKYVNKYTESEQEPNESSAPEDNNVGVGERKEVLEEETNKQEQQLPEVETVEYIIKENIFNNIPNALIGKLRNYQLYGLDWLVSLYNNKLNGILADEMGLGKTIQTIALLIYLKENKGISGNHIIIAPLSTLHSNWKSEFELWYPSFKLCVYEGSKELRKNLRTKWYTGNKLNFDVLLTSETFVLRDKNFLKKICWEYLIIDEVHKFKSENSKLFKILNNLFISKRRLLLTGTSKMKNDVLDELPSSYEYIISCPMSGIQTRLYEFFHMKDTQNKFLQLRKICNHPFLYVNNNFIPCNDLIINSSGKMCILDMILSRLYYVNHRVLIFSQMTSLLDILEVYLNYRSYKYLRLDGNLSSEKRLERINLFNEPDSQYFVFILSTKAGSLGINLQSADTVIIYDSDWNPQNDLQAQSRVHRIGQKNQVITLRLITPNTIEDNIYRFKYNINSLNSTTKGETDVSQNEPTESINESEKSSKHVENENHEENKERSDDVDHNDHIIDTVPLLNNVLKRNEGDTKVFDLVSYRNFILNPLTLIKQRVLPPFLYKSLTSNKKLHISEDEKRKLSIENEIWLNIYNDYNVYSAEVTVQCSKNYINAINNEVNINHIITNLNINYPVECLKNITNESTSKDYTQVGRKKSKEVETLVDKEVLKLVVNKNEKKLSILNTVIFEIVEGVVEGKNYVEFNELPNKQYLSDYYEKIQNPICLLDIMNKSKENRYTSVFHLKESLELLCNNARSYNGIDSYLFYKSLNLYNHVVTHVTFSFVVEFISIYDMNKGKRLKRLLAEYI